MKKVLLATSLLAASAIPFSAQALPFGLSAAAKLGVYQVETDESGIDVDPALMISGLIGYEILDLAAAKIDLEAELSTTLTDANVDFGSGSPEVDASSFTAGIYATARSLGPVYAIGKIGYIDTEFDLDTSGVEDLEESGTAIGVGVGFGSGIRTEIELTRHEIEDDEAYYLSLGFGF